jgi:hypothetical protein
MGTAGISTPVMEAAPMTTFMKGVRVGWLEWMIILVVDMMRLKVIKVTTIFKTAPEVGILMGEEVAFTLVLALTGTILGFILIVETMVVLMREAGITETIREVDGRIIAGVTMVARAEIVMSI